MYRAAIIFAMACGRVGFDERDVACPATYVDRATGCYRVDETSRSWYDAELACEAEGGHLVVIDDDAERLAVLDATPTLMDVWLGATARVAPGEYISVTRAPFHFTWMPSEPNASGACVELQNGEMDDHDCLNPNDFVCEIDGVLADPTTY